MRETGKRGRELTFTRKVDLRGSGTDTRLEMAVVAGSGDETIDSVPDSEQSFGTCSCSLSLSLSPVSYTHLTLPTTAEV